MTYIFQHKKEANRIKMIDAESMEDAEEKLLKRLSKGSIIINGIKTFESVNNYKYLCKI